MKYKNIASKIRFVVIFYNIISILLIITSCICEDILNCIIIGVVLVLSSVLLDFMFIYLSHLWYFTYIYDDKITQLFFKRKKEIFFKNIKCIYLIDNLLILSDLDIGIVSNIDYTFLQKKAIKDSLKNKIIITINDFDSYLPAILRKKCYHTKKIKIGKISKNIERKFMI